MENKRDTTNARECKRLNLYFSKNASQLVKSEALSYFTISSKKESDFQITYSKNFLIQNILTNLKIECVNEQELVCHLINLSKIIEVKDFETHFPFNFEDDANAIFKNVTNIQGFLYNLRKSAFFRDFSSCQFLVHEKGQAQAFSISLINDDIGDKKLLTSLSFNNILTRIKKSKNKQFQVNEITSESLDVIGSFLAKEFEHKDFNFIILASRGGLFNTSKDDKDFYTQFLTSYQNILFDIVSCTIKEFQNKKASLIVSNFPIFLRTIKSDEVISSQKLQELETVLININDVLIEYSKQNFLSTEADLYHQERVILMGELLNTLKHELSNPLFGIQIASEILLLDEKDHDADSIDLINEIKKSASRCQNIISSFSDLYLEGDQIQTVSLKHLIEETITLTKSETKFLKKTIIFNGAQDYTIKVNTTFLSQIIFNLVINSSQALKDLSVENKEIKIIVSEEESFIKMNFLDNGLGIEENFKDKIFTPFYTSKETGTGLGLSICKKMANKLKGDIRLTSDYAPLTCFELLFLKDQES